MIKRKEILIGICFFTIFCFLFLVSNSVFVSSEEYVNSTLNITVTIEEPVAMVDISPAEINFGTITRGFETDVENITFTNMGAFGVSVNPVLENNNSFIWSGLRFRSSGGTSWFKLGTWAGINLDEPSYYGENPTKGAQLKLDLTDYEGEINSDQTISTNIVFWVTPN